MGKAAREEAAAVARREAARQVVPLGEAQPQLAEQQRALLALQRRAEEPLRGQPMLRAQRPVEQQFAALRKQTRVDARIRGPVG